MNYKFERGTMFRAIDTHCHLNLKAFEYDVKDVIERTLKNGIEAIVVGINFETSKKAIDLAKRFSGIYAAVGLHPYKIGNRDWRSELLQISDLINTHKVVAIGEIGFDLHEVEENEVKTTIEIQQRAFDFFIQEAKKNKKPLIIHTRDAKSQTLSALTLLKKNRVKGVWHCYSSNLTDAKKAIDAGLLIGFTGLITYDRSYDNVITKIPLDKIVVETDAPFLSPAPLRGKRNEPSNVLYVVSQIAKLLGRDEESIAKQLYENAKKLFNI